MPAFASSMAGMLNKLALALAIYITVGFPGLALANAESERGKPVVAQARSTATILPGVRLSWSSVEPGGIVTSNDKQRDDISRNVVRAPDTQEKVFYVDFS